MLQWLKDKKITIVFDHYTGFEGSPEYQFVAIDQKEARVFRMWNGWFDTIMRNVTPKETSWTSLALVYHLDQGWFEKSPWKLESVRPAIAQLQESHKQLKSTETQNICRELIDFLSSEYNRGAAIFIVYD